VAFQAARLGEHARPEAAVPAVDACIEQRVLLGPGDEAPRLGATGKAAELEEAGANAFELHRVAPVLHAAGAASARLRKRRLDGVVRRALAAVGPHQA
jgi:hypothetical protein